MQRESSSMQRKTAANNFRLFKSSIPSEVYFYKTSVSNTMTEEDKEQFSMAQEYAKSHSNMTLEKTSRLVPIVDFDNKQTKIGCLPIELKNAIELINARAIVHKSDEVTCTTYQNRDLDKLNKLEQLSMEALSKPEKEKIASLRSLCLFRVQMEIFAHRPNEEVNSPQSNSKKLYDAARELPDEIKSSLKF